MQINSHLVVHENVHIEVLDGALLDRGVWKVLDEQRVKNRVVTTGKTYLGLLLKGSHPAPTQIRVGTNAQAVALTDTALLNEVFGDVITQRVTITDGARFRFLLPTTAANGVSLVEAGIFGPSDLMLARVVYSAIAKTVSIAVNYSWDLTFSQIN